MTTWDMGVGATGTLRGFTRGAITLHKISDGEGAEWRHIAFRGNGTLTGVRCITVWRFGLMMKTYYTAKEREYGGRMARKNGIKRGDRHIVEQEELQAMFEGFLHEYVQSRMDARLTRGPT